MSYIIKRIKEENANSLVENVIILPLIFIIIFLMIMTCFVMHDRSTLDAAAKRGVIFAAHCISDPNYDSIRAKSGNQAGSLDLSDGVNGFTFKGVGKNIQPYRYLKKTTDGLKSKVESEINAIIKNTKIPWNEIDVDNIKFTQVNKMYYQDVTVEIKATYPLPKLFEAFGLPGELEYKAQSKMTVNDPDEFIRNADMAVDILTSIDDKYGNHVSKALDKISVLADKLLEWLDK